MNENKIYITILYNSALSNCQIQEVCAGLEEEGVPFILQKWDKSINFIELGREAASRSSLQVGIGIDQNGNLCVHHEKLKPEEPYLIDRLQNGRTLGKNAARLIKGLPLSIYLERMGKDESDQFRNSEKNDREFRKESERN